MRLQAAIRAWPLHLVADRDGADHDLPSYPRGRPEKPSPSLGRVSETIAERYLRLGLRLGRHVDGLVDSYAGPPELATEVESEPHLGLHLLLTSRLGSS